MNDLANDNPSANFWIIGGAALVWNLIGLMFYYSHVTMTPEALQGFTVEQQAFFVTAPKWATSAYAIAVTAGVLGCILLLLRKSWAVPVLALSLAGVIVQDLHAFVLSNGLDAFGATGLVMPAIVVVIAIALLMYARSAKAAGWLT